MQKEISIKNNKNTQPYLKKKYFAHKMFKEIKIREGICPARKNIAYRQMKKV
jgi:hypothetical protein